MKWKIIMIISFVITLLGLNVYQEERITVEKQKANAQPVILSPNHDSNFVRVAQSIISYDDNNNPLNGLTFKLKSYNDSFEYTSMSGDLYQRDSTQSTDGHYYINDFDDELSFEEIERALTPSQKDKIHNIRTVNDLDRIFGDDSFCEEEICKAYMYTYFILEETEVPEGYVKKKVIIPGQIEVFYNSVNSNNNQDNSELELANITIMILQASGYLEYGEVNREELFDPDLEFLEDQLDEIHEERGYCESIPAVINPYSGTIYVFPLFKAAPVDSDIADNPVIVNRYACHTVIRHERGTVDYEISFSVNDKENITAGINQILEYKVNVKNTGTVDAIDNTVTAKLSQGFIYVEGSASHNGTYKDGVITWNVDRINKEDEINLTYQAYASKEINITESHIGEASVKNFASEAKTDSNKTYVKLSLTNPYTYAPIGMIVFILSIVCIPLIIMIKKQRKQK